MIHAQIKRFQHSLSGTEVMILPRGATHGASTTLFVSCQMGGTGALPSQQFMGAKRSGWDPEFPTAKTGAVRGIE